MRVRFPTTPNTKNKTQTFFGGILLDVKTQQIIIIILGILAIASVVKGNQTTLDIIIAGLIGFLSNKTLTDKQSEIIENQIQAGKDDVQ